MAAAPPANLWFCHECQTSMIPLRVPDPACSACNGSFVEEIDSNESDDPRQYDPPAAAIPFNFGPGGGGRALRVAAGGQRMAVGDGQGGAVMMRIIGPGGGAMTVTGNGAPSPLNALMQAFGLVPPVAAGGGGRLAEVGDPEEVNVVAGEGEEAPPIRNLASFLTGAFAPHPADDVANNPFAEGASEQDEAQRRRAASEGAQDDAQPHPPFGNAPAGLGGATPLNYLFSLLNSFGAGGNGQVMFGQNGQTGNVGDFAWGEAGFQAILNDLMEQASGRAGPQPATEEAIAGLSSLTVTKEILETESVRDCPICREDYTDGEVLTAMPCQHAFHPTCITQWLRTSGTCPVCRFPMVPQPGDAPAAEGVVPPPEAAAPAAPASQTAVQVTPEARRGSGSIPGSFPETYDGETDEDEESQVHRMLVDDLD